MDRYNHSRNVCPAAETVQLVRWPFFIVVVRFNSSKSWLTTQTLAHIPGSQTGASVVPSMTWPVRLLRSRPWTRWSPITNDMRCVSRWRVGAKTTSWFNYQLIWMWRVNGAHNTATSASSSSSLPAFPSQTGSGAEKATRRYCPEARLLCTRFSFFLFFNLEFERLPDNKYSRNPYVCLCGGLRRSSYTRKDPFEGIVLFQNILQSSVRDWKTLRFHFGSSYKTGRCLEGAAVDTVCRKSVRSLGSFPTRDEELRGKSILLTLDSKLVRHWSY